MRKLTAAFVMMVAASPRGRRSRSRRAPGPIVVLDTVKGTIEFETYPEEAPKTVARIVELVKKNFYNGQRFHRAEPNFVDSDRRSGDRATTAGSRGGGVRARARRSASPRSPRSGATSWARWRWPTPAPTRRRPTASSSSCAARRPELDGKYTVFGKVLKGMDVVAKIQRGDVLKRAYLKE